MKKSSKLNKKLKSSDKNSNVINFSNNYKTASIYDIKRKRDSLIDKKFKPTYNNRAGIFKHNPPAVKEWRNSIYAFNKNSIKTLYCSDNSIFKLLKSYFNLYDPKLDVKMRSKRLRVRDRRLTVDRVLISKPDMKHTNDEINITLHTYDRRKLHYISKLKTVISLDTIKSSGLFNMHLKNIKEKSKEIEPKIEGRVNTLIKTITLNKHVSMLEHFGKIYLKLYVYKYMQKEITSIRHEQSICIQKSKYEKQYLLPLARLLERIFNKKVLFNIVNLKYFYNSSSIFSEALIIKLKNRKNNPTTVLKESLNTFTLPLINRLAVYDEIYNRRTLTQGLNVNSVTLSNINATSIFNKDFLEESLLHNYENDNNKPVSQLTPIVFNLNQVIGSLKHKLTSGIRIEVAGRLTKRNTAARSMLKLKYKGSIKNTDSSYKGLSTVLLRGYAKSNLSYNQLKSKLRIGSFGLKTWISSS